MVQGRGCVQIAATTKPFSSLLIIQHYPTLRISFTSILTCFTHRCRNIFKNLPLVAYRFCKNINDILVRAQLTKSTDTSNSRPTPGSFRCNNRNCTTCPHMEHGLACSAGVFFERAICSRKRHVETFRREEEMEGVKGSGEGAGRESIFSPLPLPISFFHSIWPPYR